jgi:hypothetical protein
VPAPRTSISSCMPLRHDPGHAQVDFGEALAEIAEGSVRCSASGGHTNCSRTGCARSSARAIPALGWMFNTIVPANITGGAAHRRATSSDASNPCTIKAVSVIGVARSTSCRGRHIGESPSRGEGFGQKPTMCQCRFSPVTETDVVDLGHTISHAGISRRTSTGLSLAPTLTGAAGYPRPRLNPVGPA